VNAGRMLAGSIEAFCRWPRGLPASAVTGEAAFILLEGTGRAGLASSPGASVSGAPKPRSKIGHRKASKKQTKRLSVLILSAAPCVYSPGSVLPHFIPKSVTPWILLARCPDFMACGTIIGDSLAVGAGMTSIVGSGSSRAESLWPDYWMNSPGDLQSGKMLPEVKCRNFIARLLHQSSAASDRSMGNCAIRIVEVGGYVLPCHIAGWDNSL